MGQISDFSKEKDAGCSKKTQADLKTGERNSYCELRTLPSKGDKRPMTHSTSISGASFLKKMEVVDLRTQWDMQKVSTAPQKLSRNK